MISRLTTILGFLGASLSYALLLLAQEPTKRVPIPDTSAQTEAAKVVREVYGDEWGAAKKRAAKQAVAKKLLEKGKETENDNAARFVLYKSSTSIAIEASDCEAAFQAIDEMGKYFRIDALNMKVDALRECGASATTIDQDASVAEKASELSEQTIAKDNFTVAKQLNNLALDEARKAKNASLVKKAMERRAEVEVLVPAYEASKTAMVTLEATPADAEANLKVGEYRCFYKGDWDGGLSMLALGNDQTIKSLAATELKGTASSDDQAKLGDGWWNLAETQEGTMKKQIQGRAGYWYQKAAPRLSGLAKDKVEERLARLTTVKVEREATGLSPVLQQKSDRTKVYKLQELLLSRPWTRVQIKGTNVGQRYRFVFNANGTCVGKLGDHTSKGTKWHFANQTLIVGATRYNYNEKDKRFISDDELFYLE